jgi:hypothetical protein
MASGPSIARQRLDAKDLALAAAFLTTTSERQVVM